MEYKKELIDILAEEKSSIDNLKQIIKERTQLSKKVAIIKKQLDELNDNLLTLEKKFDYRIQEIGIHSDKVKALFNEVFKNDLNETAMIIKDNLPNTIEGIIQTHNHYPIIKLEEKCSKLELGNVTIYFSNHNEYVAKVHLEDKRNNFHCEEQFVLQKPNRVFKVISYINTNLNYDE